MTQWKHHLDPLDQEGHGWRCADRLEELLAGEEVLDVTAGIERDVCDDGHVHTDVTLGLLTASRLLHVVAGDAHHVTDEHELGLQFDTAVLPLSAIRDVSVSCWSGNDGPVAEVIVPRPGSGWQAVGDIHDCGDPECDIPPGSVRLEARSEAVTFLAAGRGADELLRFAGGLSRAVGADRRTP